MEGHKYNIKALKSIRNKHLVHNDSEYFMKSSELYNDHKVFIDDIFQIIDYVCNYLNTVAQLMQPQYVSASVCPQYHELMDIQSLEMYFRNE